MDGLRQLSRSLFDESQRFRADVTPGLRLKTFEIALFPDDGPPTGEAGRGVFASSANVAEMELVLWAAEKTSSDARMPEARLKMVRFDRTQVTTVNVSKQVFGELYGAIRADPAALYVVCSEYDGFHSFEGDGYLPTWFIGTSTYAFLWTFDMACRQTAAIFMNRKLNCFEDICSVLRVYGTCAHIPHILSLAVCIHQQHRFDAETADELAIIHEIERHTGFGPSTAGPGTVTDIDKLKNWSQAVGKVGVNITNKIRHQGTSGRLLALVKETQLASLQGVGVGVVKSDGRVMERYESSLDTLGEMIPVIERHMAAYAEYLEYLKHRTERLSSVLFVLLTHGDARASIHLAAESKRDSSSMKTVAIMTMAFLPGTFFAALFAMPSLQWNKPDVIQSNFWVFWAFTLPVTVLVFCAWFGIIERKWIIGLIRAQGKKSTGELLLHTQAPEPSRNTL